MGQRLINGFWNMGKICMGVFSYYQSVCRTLHHPSYPPILRPHDHHAHPRRLLKLIGPHWKWPSTVKTSLPKPRSIRTTTVYSAIFFSTYVTFYSSSDLCTSCSPTLGHILNQSITLLNNRGTRSNQQDLKLQLKFN